MTYWPKATFEKPEIFFRFEPYSRQCKKESEGMPSSWVNLWSKLALLYRSLQHQKSQGDRMCSSLSLGGQAGFGQDIPPQAERGRKCLSCEKHKTPSAMPKHRSTSILFMFTVACAVHECAKQSRQPHRSDCCGKN